MVGNRKTKVPVSENDFPELGNIQFELTEDEPGPAALLRNLEALLAHMFDHVELLNRVGIVQQTPPLFSALTPHLETMINLGARDPDNLAFGDVAELMQGISSCADKVEDCPPDVKAAPMDERSLVDFPLQPTLNFETIPVVTRGASDPLFTGVEWSQLLDEILRESRDIYRRQNPSVRRAIRGAFIRLVTAIQEARRSGSISGVGAAVEAFRRALARFGIGARPYMSRIIAAMTRFVPVAAGGATAGQLALVAAYYVTVVALLFLWMKLWDKIGCWLWNSEVVGSGQTYIEFWADVAYGFTTTSDCDKLWRNVVRANNRVRELERTGATGNQLRLAAAVAMAGVQKLLNTCETAIRPTLEAMLARYSEILARPIDDPN